MGLPGDWTTALNTAINQRLADDEELLIKRMVELVTPIATKWQQPGESHTGKAQFN